ncbi:2Fe-2S iron-sulfur cluster binding domain-containing protein [Jannaschia sp. Os4]|uniref:2Fe-2S iron-sulfur cluster-binding protein n=1 Tax=Jannaschia sp. Os4 TaxID=2807617 RepID=UPI0019393CC6|nr:2Fe-2S iron-sulfur cluster-binding protein [Jannaschia sp. Os4]MBM2576715.1 2Fe-2S iron-sulfur cluster binding domain-containing protein [Jannaschia sp. Os4]
MSARGFHPLTVAAVRPTIRDAVEVTLDHPGWDWSPGQYLTFRRDFDGTEVRRSYSICTEPGAPLRVGIKRVEGGAFSAWANTALRPGDTVEAMPPQGRFWGGETHGHTLLFAGGSGITPVLGVLRHLLAADPEARATLVYANVRTATIMFRDEIEDLKQVHLGRLSVVHVLERDAQEIDLFTGRVTPEKCADLFARWIDVRGAARAYICGPEPMMLGIRDALAAHGMPEEAIRFELFASAQPGRLPQAERAVAADAPTIPLAVTLDGATSEIDLAPGQTVLEAAEAAGLEAPWSCRAGVCSTCRCRVVAGAVEMDANHAIEDDELRDGYVLSCQARPAAGTERVAVSYDLGH